VSKRAFHALWSNVNIPEYFNKAGIFYLSSVVDESTASSVAVSVSSFL